MAGSDGSTALPPGGVAASSRRRSFLRHYLLELAADIGEDITELVALLELLALAPQPLTKVIQAGEVGSRRVAGPPAPLHEASKGLGEIALGHHVVRQGIDDLVGIESGDRLCPVPARVAGGPGEERVAGGCSAGGRPEIAWIGAERGHAPTPVRRTTDGALIAGRRSPLRIDPC
jgi:hypothetical protein